MIYDDSVDDDGGGEDDDGDDVDGDSDVRTFEGDNNEDDDN